MNAFMQIGMPGQPDGKEQGTDRNGGVPRLLTVLTVASWGYGLPSKRGIAAQFEDCAAQLRAGRLASDGALMQSVSSLAGPSMSGPLFSDAAATCFCQQGLFFRLCGCDGHDAPECEDGSRDLAAQACARGSLSRSFAQIEGCQRLFRRLLSARCEGSAWSAGEEAALRRISSVSLFHLQGFSYRKASGPSHGSDLS